MGIYRNFISMVSMDFLFFLQCLILQQYILNWSFWNLLVMYLHKISQMRFFLTNLFQKCWSQFSKFPLHVSKVRSLMSTKLLTNYFWKIGKWKMLKISLFFCSFRSFLATMRDEKSSVKKFSWISYFNSKFSQPLFQWEHKYNILLNYWWWVFNSFLFYGFLKITQNQN